MTGSTPVTLADLLTGIIIFGATGSGKTTGPGKWLAIGILKHPMRMGMLILCAKPGEAEQWIAWAKAAGRINDVRLFGIGRNSVFNFMDLEANHPSGGGSTQNIVEFLMELTAASAPEGAFDGAGENQFFYDSARYLLTNTIDLLRLAQMPITMDAIRDIIMNAPRSAKEAADPKWAETSPCFKALAKAFTSIDPKNADQVALHRECENWFLREYPVISDKTRGIINLCVSMVVRTFLVPPLRALFSGTTNMQPEDIFNGYIIIIDIPTQTYFKAGELAQIAWKRCFQNAVLRHRMKNPRPVVLWADEAQAFITRFDAEYQAVARSQRAATVYLTQTREGLRDKLGNDAAVDSLLANLQQKFFCQNGSIETNEYASRLLGSRYIDVDSTNVSAHFGQQFNQQQNGGMHGGSSTSEQQRHYVEESEFARLLKGGHANNYRVSCIYYQGGNTFPLGDERVPYLRLTFDQRK